MEFNQTNQKQGDVNNAGIPKPETKECPICRSKMILRFVGYSSSANPPRVGMGGGIYPRNWCCGCGHTEKGPDLREKTEEQHFREAWEAANR